MIIDGKEKSRYRSTSMGSLRLRRLHIWRTRHYLFQSHGSPVLPAFSGEGVSRELV